MKRISDRLKEAAERREAASWRRRTWRVTGQECGGGIRTDYGAEKNRRRED